ncbi:DNA adenine methylase [Rhizobium leguminosarum]|uniref:DNA adenine methylase n=1 Tax=Rhizobium leguminosarum TaxID=384 RepID=UPI003F96AF5E
MRTTRPLLRWAGSKRSAMAHLVQNMPSDFNQYVEPFVGSAALFFALEPRAAVLSDLNPDLINFYKILQQHPLSIHNDFSMLERSRETYVEIRFRFSSEEDPYQRAVQFVYLNRNCFNGLYRTNKRGQFNVPFAERGRAQYPTVEDFKSAAELTRNANLVVADFRQVIDERVMANDLVYLDPPYLLSEGRIFTEYVKGHFCKQDMDDLSCCLRTINARGAKFIVSFIDDPIIDEIKGEWNFISYEVQRNISGFAAARKRYPELLIKNW